MAFRLAGPCGLGWSDCQSNLRMPRRAEWDSAWLGLAGLGWLDCQSNLRMQRRAEWHSAWPGSAGPGWPDYQSNLRMQRRAEWHSAWLGYAELGWSDCQSNLRCYMDTDRIWTQIELYLLKITHGRYSSICVSSAQIRVHLWQMLFLTPQMAISSISSPSAAPSTAPLMMSNSVRSVLRKALTSMEWTTRFAPILAQRISCAIESPP